MLRQTLTHDCETSGQVAFDTFQQRISKLSIQGAMPIAIAHGRRIEARFIGLDGERERSRTLRLLASGDRSSAHIPTPGLKRQRVRVLREAHLGVLDLVWAFLLLLLLLLLALLLVVIRTYVA